MNRQALGFGPGGVSPWFVWLQHVYIYAVFHDYQLPSLQDSYLRSRSHAFHVLVTFSPISYSLADTGATMILWTHKAGQGVTILCANLARL